MSADDADGEGEGAASRIYVGNLIPKANEVHLRNLFARFGVIHNIWIARKPPGFAFVSYESPDCAARAVEAFEMVKDGEHAMEILGKLVKVQMAGEKGKKKTTASGQSTHKSDSSAGVVKKKPVKEKKRVEPHRDLERKESDADRDRRHSPVRRRKRSWSPTRSSKSSDDEVHKRRSRSVKSNSRGRRRSRSRSHRQSRSLSRDSRSRHHKHHGDSTDRRSRSESRDRKSRRYSSNSRSRSRSRRSRRRPSRRSTSQSQSRRTRSRHSRSSSPSWN